MKTLVALLAGMAMLVCSCKIPQYAIGMSENQFKSENHNATLVGAKGDVTVYRISRQRAMSWDDNTFYYYFKSGKLAQMDQGVYKPDVLVQVQNSK